MQKLTYKEARERAGIHSQSTMAKLLGMRPMTYNLKENYQRSWRVDEFMDFCEKVGCKAENLIIKRL